MIPLCRKNKERITYGRYKQKYNSYNPKSLKSVNKIKSYFHKQIVNNN